METEGTQGTTRRTALDTAIKSGLTVWFGGMAIPATLYLLPAGAGGPKEGLYEVGPADSFKSGTARLIQGDGKPILVISLGKNRFRAFSAICTHLGCVVKWSAETGKILCPCHTGIFGNDGAPVSGPPTRPLPEYEVLVSDNTVVVKT